MLGSTIDCTRRDFLHTGAALGLALSGRGLLESAGAAPRSGDLNVIQLFLVGGPSHLETFDPKPDAPDAIRGPFRAIQTRTPGLRFSEHLPRLAERTHRFSVIRSLFHRESPVHETGHQLLQTGFLSRDGVEHPHFGAVLSKLHGPRNEMPPWLVLPRPIGNTGVSVSHGQSSGFLGGMFEPIASASSPASTHLAAQRIHRALTPPARLGRESTHTRERYGDHSFGHSCLQARRLVEQGVRLVTVNMFETVFNQITWDCHANGSDLDSTLDDYRDVLCPMLDQAVSALLDDLTDRGLIKNTLVLCMGEFGRTPKINNRGGRDHWPSCWSALLAGGPVQPGRVIGASDAHGMEPADRPVHAAEIVATVYHALGVDLETQLRGPNGERLPICEAKPVVELF